MRCIHTTVHTVQGGREKDDEDDAGDEEEKEDAEVRAVEEASERPSWKECEHEGEEREQVSLIATVKSGPALKKGGVVHLQNSVSRPSHLDQMTKERMLSSHRTRIMNTSIQLFRYSNPQHFTYARM